MTFNKVYSVPLGSSYNLRNSVSQQTSDRQRDLRGTSAEKQYQEKLQTEKELEELKKTRH